MSSNECVAVPNRSEERQEWNERHAEYLATVRDQLMARLTDDERQAIQIEITRRRVMERLSSDELEALGFVTVHR